MSTSSGTSGWLRSRDWHRVGRGLTIQFYATDEEVASWLGRMPAEFGPYSLVGFDRVSRPSGRYEWWPFDCSVSDFFGCLAGQRERRFKWFIRSRRLTPTLPTRDLSDERDWSLNGLIDVQHGARFRERQVASSMGITSAVENDQTGERVRHEAYEQIFASLRRSVREHANRPTLRSFPDGRQIEDRTLALMTDGAVALARQGHAFDVDPMADP